MQPVTKKPLCIFPCQLLVLSRVEHSIVDMLSVKNCIVLTWQDGLPLQIWTTCISPLTGVFVIKDRGGIKSFCSLSKQGCQGGNWLHNYLISLLLTFVRCIKRKVCVQSRTHWLTHNLIEHWQTLQLTADLSPPIEKIFQVLTNNQRLQESPFMFPSGRSSTIMVGCLPCVWPLILVDLTQRIQSTTHLKWTSKFWLSCFLQGEAAQSWLVGSPQSGCPDKISIHRKQ